MDNLRLFTMRQIITVTIFAGPISGYWMLARNFSLTAKKIHAIGARIIAIVASIINYPVLIALFDNEGYFNTLLEENILFGVMAAVGLLMVFQTVWLIPLFIWRKDQIFPSTHASLRSVLGYASVGILLTVSLFFFGPFRFTFLMILALPHLYVYNRIKMALRNSTQKRIMLALLIFLVLSFPVGQFIYRTWNNELTQFIVQLSYYYLPFILYFVLLITLRDVVNLAGNITVRFKPLKSRKIKFHKISLIVITMLSVIIVAFGSWNFNTPRPTFYSLTIDKGSSSLDSLRVAMASDFHLAEITNKHLVSRFVERIDALKPDIVLLPGDIMESGTFSQPMQQFTGELKQLSADLGIYASTGNHEYYGMYNEKIKLIEQSNINLIVDSTIVFDDKFILVGRNDEHDRNRKSLNELIPDSLDLPVIVMDHRPGNFENLSKTSAGLILSGHTHHGQLFPFHWITNNIYELSWGHRQVGKTHFIVSAGIQGWGPQVRTSAYSEIVVVDLKLE